MLGARPLARTFSAGSPGLELTQLLAANLENIEDVERLQELLRCYLAQLYQKCPGAWET